jgi:predicted  nucleic acid-binding Zn-ribbon protein
MSDDEFKKLKEEHDEAQEKAAEARGIAQSLRKRLEEDFGLKDLPSARKRLKTMSSEVARLRQEFEADLSRYRKEFNR